MRNKTVILLPLVLLLGCACGGGRAVPEPSGYHTAAGMIVAPDGQALFLRGINVREEAKYHSAHIIPLADGELVELTASGFTAVRLLAFWQAVMPQPDTIDEDYLDRLEAEARRLDGHGFFLVIDMHQDLWGEPFGDGAPGWACPEELKEGYESVSPWWANYTSEQVMGCYDLFWESEALQQQWIDAFRAGAAIYLGTFLLGNNWDYRLIFLILAIPQLVAWARDSACAVRRAARVVLAAILVSLWHLMFVRIFCRLPHGYLLSTLIDGLAGWTAFAGLTYILCRSLPDWVREDGHGTYAPWGHAA